MKRMVGVVVGLVGTAALAGTAVAQDGTGTAISLSSHAGVVGGQRAVFVDLEARGVDGHQYQLIVFRQPGWVPCQENPQLRWPRGSQQLLYSFKDVPGGLWGKWVAVPLTSGGKWTACGYVVAESNLREEVSWPYVLKRTEHRFRAPGLRRGEANPWSAPRVACKLGRHPRVVWVKAPSRAAASCRRAIRIARTWSDTAGDQGAGSNNWSLWDPSLGVGFRPPEPSFMRLSVPGIGNVACRVRQVGKSRWTSEVTCARVRFLTRF